MMDGYNDDDDDFVQLFILWYFNFSKSADNE